jgi:hypothetical protein
MESVIMLSVGLRFGQDSALATPHFSLNWPRSDAGTLTTVAVTFVCLELCVLVIANMEVSVETFLHLIKKRHKNKVTFETGSLICTLLLLPRLQLNRYL